LRASSTSFWVYIVGSLVGGAVAAPLYNVVSIAGRPSRLRSRLFG
jgi:glycerol uptake facilitator-like aquaporin